MGSFGHRLLAVLIAFGLAVLLRPTGAVAADGPVAVNCVESSDISLHTPRRAVTSLDHDVRGFVSALISELTESWGAGGPSVGCVRPGFETAHRARSRDVWRSRSRGPPAG